MNQKGLGERKCISYDSITCTGSMGIISAYLLGKVISTPFWNSGAKIKNKLLIIVPFILAIGLKRVCDLFILFKMRPDSLRSS